MSVVYWCTTLTWSSDLQPAGVYLIILYGLQEVCRWWSVHRYSDKQEGTVGVKLEPSPLRLPTLHSGSSPGCPALPWKCTRTFNFWEIFKGAFKIYGIRPQASKQARIHTHFRNAVPLVWGSLRLAPIMMKFFFYLRGTRLEVIDEQCMMGTFLDRVSCLSIQNLAIVWYANF